jgi:hypothetical protein
MAHGFAADDVNMTLRIPPPLVMALGALLVAAVAVVTTLALTGGSARATAEGVSSAPTAAAKAVAPTRAEIEDRVETAFVNSAQGANVTSVTCNPLSAGGASRSDFRCFIAYFAPDPTSDLYGAMTAESASLTAHVDSAGGVRIQRYP